MWREIYVGLPSPGNLKLSECRNICESSSPHYLSLPLSGLFLVIREDTDCTGEDTSQIFDQELRWAKWTWVDHCAVCFFHFAYCSFWLTFGTLQHASMCSSLSSLHARWQRCCVSHQETWWQGVTMILFPRCGDSEGGQPPVLFQMVFIFSAPWPQC